jgi:hypothetical protein
MQSVAEYCLRHEIDYQVQRKPKLKIAPDPFMNNRSREATARHGGFLPIYEKENAFDMMDEYDQIAIIDADIYIRPDAPNIFDDFGTEHAWGSVCEREMPLENWYKNKILNYSQMQYHTLHTNRKIDFKPNRLGYEFFNMGMILINSENLRPYLKGQTAKQFLNRAEFMDFINGKGHWKWSTDQTLLNYFLKKYKIPTKHMDAKWNGLYTANTNIKECHFVHFFLKHKLPDNGENVDKLMETIS